MTNKEREFVGFLFGEGCFRISRHKQKGWGEGRYLFRTDVQVSLRDDDPEILIWAKENYGGTLMFRPADTKSRLNAKPSVMWILTSAITVKKVCEQCLKSELPSVKKKQIELLLKICNLKRKRLASGHKHSFGRWYTDEEYLSQEEAYKKLSELKKYRGSE